jgi:hypothetical protein
MIVETLLFQLIHMVENAMLDDTARFQVKYLLQQIERQLVQCFTISVKRPGQNRTNEKVSGLEGVAVIVFRLRSRSM